MIPLESSLIDFARTADTVVIHFGQSYCAEIVSFLGDASKMLGENVCQGGTTQGNSPAI